MSIGGEDIKTCRRFRGAGPQEAKKNANYVLAVLLNSEFHFGPQKSYPPPAPNQVVLEFSVNIYTKLYKR